MLSSSDSISPGEGREVIEAYRLFAYDQGWRQRMRDAVRTGLTGRSRGRARARRDPACACQRLGDPILRERAHDLDDLARPPAAPSHRRRP
jgi:phosphotransferase system enzyme I (PtsP)